MPAKRRRRQRPDPLATTSRVRTSGHDHRHRQPHRERRGRLRHRHPTRRCLSGAHIPERLARRERELPLQRPPHSRWPRPHHKQLRRPVDPTRELVASRPSLGHTPFYYHPSRPIPPRHQPQRTVELEPTYCIQFAMAVPPVLSDLGLIAPNAPNRSGRGGRTATQTSTRTRTTSERSCDAGSDECAVGHSISPSARRTAE